MIYNQLDGENQLGKYDVQFSPMTHWTHVWLDAWSGCVRIDSTRHMAHHLSRPVKRLISILLNATSHVTWPLWPYGRWIINKHQQNNYPGWWFQPLWKIWMSSSVRMIIPWLSCGEIQVVHMEQIRIRSILRNPRIGRWTYAMAGKMFFQEICHGLPRHFSWLQPSLKMVLLLRFARSILTLNPTLW